MNREQAVDTVGMAFEVQNIPETGRTDVQSLPRDGLVTVGLFSDCVAGKAFFSPGEARILAAELVTAARLVEIEESD